MENKGFFTALVCFIALYNFLLAGIFIGLCMYSLGSVMTLLSVILIGLFFGWKAASVMEYFKATSAQLVINSVFSSSIILLMISAIGLTLSKLGPTMEMLASDGVSVMENQLFQINVPLVIILGILFIASFNFFTARLVYQTEPQKFWFFAIGLAIWITIFLLGWLMASWVLQGAMSTTTY